MKIFNLNTPFSEGKYQGKTLEEVFVKDPAYIEKKLMAEDDFVIDERSIQKLFEKYPDSELSDDAIDVNLSKLDSTEDDDDLFLTEKVYDDDLDSDLEDPSIDNEDLEDDIFGDDDDLFEEPSFDEDEEDEEI